MKKIYYTLMTLLIAAALSVKVMAQASNKPLPFKTVFDSRKADKILAQEIKRMELLQAPSLLNLPRASSNPGSKKQNFKKGSTALHGTYR